MAQVLRLMHGAGSFGLGVHTSWKKSWVPWRAMSHCDGAGEGILLPHVTTNTVIYCKRCRTINIISKNCIVGVTNS
jgi:hypothetical protein